jgi:hypothetical protein
MQDYPEGYLYSVVPPSAQQNVFIFVAVLEREDSVRVPNSLIPNASR